MPSDDLGPHPPPNLPLEGGGIFHPSPFLLHLHPSQDFTPSQDFHQHALRYTCPLFAQAPVDQGDRRLQAIDLECVRGRRRLFQSLRFTVGPGEMLWVQGANGSGKTTLLRLLCGLMRPDAGTVCWRGHEVRRTREQFSADLLYSGHAPAVKDDLTALENLRFCLAQTGIGTSVEE